MSSTVPCELGPDEISELAEFLFQECAKSAKTCGVGGPCPLLLAFGVGLGAGTISKETIEAFVTGFDMRRGFGSFRHEYDPENPAYLLGRRFREQALSGEGFK